MDTTTITVAGNLAARPELKFGPSGKARAQFRVAVDERHRNAEGDWVDGNTSWHTVIVWGKLAEHATDTLTKGSRVIVHGRLTQREYATETGEKRTVWEIVAEDLGPSLRHGPIPTQGGASAIWTDGSAPDLALRLG